MASEYKTKSKNFQNSKSKFMCIYILTLPGISQKMALTRRFLKRKMEEYEALKVEITALKSGIDEEPPKIKKATR